MEIRWVRRRSHKRGLKSGEVIFVRESLAAYELKNKGAVGPYYHPCPLCGAKILSVHMPNGGWAHFEGGRGLTRIKHPCLHRGLGLSNGRDNLTLDLFEIVH